MWNFINLDFNLYYLGKNINKKINKIENQIYFKRNTEKIAKETSKNTIINKFY